MYGTPKALAVIVLGVLLTGALGVRGEAAEKTDQPAKGVATLNVEPNSVSWLPTVEYERLILTVAGPKDFFLQQELAAGKIPSLSLFDRKGERLPDGIYTYEFRPIPRSDEQTGGALARSGESGDESLSAQARQTPQHPLVQSGYLTIRGGSFVTDFGTRPPAGGPRPSGPPPKTSVQTKQTLAPPVIIPGNVCIGSACSGDSDADIPVLKLKDSFLQLKFEDVPDGISYSRDWALQANDFLGGSDRFFILDVDANTTPFSIAGNAPNSALYVASNGNLGLGTATPSAALDVTRSTGALATLARFSNNKGIQILYDRTDAGANDWQTSNFNQTFEISIPGSPVGQFSLASNGNLTISGTTYNTGSSRELKENFAAVDGVKILQRLVDMPLTEWNAKAVPGQRHIGPVAEDWWSSFGLGPDDKHVSMTDVGGVALAAIKGLHQVVAEKETEIAALRDYNSALTKRVQALEAMVSSLMKERLPGTGGEPPER